MTSVKSTTYSTGQTVFRFSDWTATDHREVESISIHLDDKRTNFYAVMADGTTVRISNHTGVKTAMVETPESRHMYQLKASADFKPCYDVRNGSPEERLQAAFFLLQSVLSLIDEGDCFLEW